MVAQGGKSNNKQATRRSNELVLSCRLAIIIIVSSLQRHAGAHAKQAGPINGLRHDGIANARRDEHDAVRHILLNPKERVVVQVDGAVAKHLVLTVSVFTTLILSLLFFVSSKGSQRTSINACYYCSSVHVFCCFTGGVAKPQMDHSTQG